jgi:hypothetical protein
LRDPVARAEYDAGAGEFVIASELIAARSLGWEYRGRQVQQGTVVYIACEGERGLGARSEAFRSPGSARTPTRLSFCSRRGLTWWPTLTS